MTLEAKVDQILKLLEVGREGRGRTKIPDGRGITQERTPEIPIRSHFGAWKTISYRFGWPSGDLYRAAYMCQCECGTVRPVFEFQLRPPEGGRPSLSCGCKAAESAIKSRVAKRKSGK